MMILKHPTEPVSHELQMAIMLEMAIKEVLEEILYLRDELDREPPEVGDAPYDTYDAFDDIWNKMDGSENQYARKFVDNMRDIAITCGWYRIVTEDELSRTIMSPPRAKKYAFKHRGNKYKYDREWAGA